MRKLKTARRQEGLSIIELMVGAAVGLIVMIGSFALYMNASQSGLNSQRQIRLTQEARAVLDVMVHEIRRSGYWSNAASGDKNPFTERLSAPKKDLFVAGNCILFTYDATFLNASNTVNSHDHFGFRLNGAALEMLPDNPGAIDTSAGCNNAAGWQKLTDPNDVSITAMSSSVQYKCLHQTSPAAATNNASTPCATSGDVETRTVSISLTMVSTADSTNTITVTDTVLLPNNRIVP